MVPSLTVSLTDIIKEPVGLALCCKPPFLCFLTESINIKPQFSVAVSDEHFVCALTQNKLVTLYSDRVYVSSAFSHDPSGQYNPWNVRFVSFRPKCLRC